MGADSGAAVGQPEEWSAFLPMVPPAVTHNDLEPYRRRGGGLGIRKSERLRDAEDAILARLRACDTPRRPFDGPLGLVVRWCYPTGGKRPQGAPHTSKPDTSNALKTLEDLLQRAGVVADDRLICHHELDKAWSDPAGIFILVYRIGGSE